MEKWNMDHQGKKPLLIVKASCAKFSASLKGALISSGLWVVQSFDLQSARKMHEGCACPHHGTDQCSCDLVVLLVYRSVGGPITLLLDGRDGDTYVFATDEAGKAYRPSTLEVIGTAIQKTTLDFQEEVISALVK